MGSDVSAAVTMNVIPEDGINRIRFGRVDDRFAVQDKEVRFRIISTEPKQYQVTQRLLEPLENEKGEILDGQVIFFTTQSGSNSSGTLYFENKQPLGFAEQLFYTSDPLGSSDAFTVYYKIVPDQLTRFGNFQGKILYTVRSIGSGTQNETVLNVSLESSGELKITTRGSSGENLVRLNSNRSEQTSGFFKITFNDQFAHDVQIYQEVLEPLKDELFQELGPQSVQFYVDSPKEGESRYQTLSDIDPQKKLIYSGKVQTNTITIHYALNMEEIENLKAARYQGTLRYLVISDNIKKNFNISIHVSIQPIFKMTVNFPDEGVSFKNLLPNGPPQTREVVVDVKSNLGKPYLVNQDVDFSLANEKGKEFVQDYFTMKEIFIKGTAGNVKFHDFVPVSEKSTPIYSSDKQGSSARFKVIYQLRPYPKMVPGNYATSIRYSLLEI